MSSETSEGARRLRAAVRAVLSPAVWAIVVSHFGFTLVRLVSAPTSSPEGANVLPLAVMLGLMMLLIYYLQAGLFQTLVHSREAVGLGAVVVAARDVFARFLWLAVKLGLLFAGIVMLLMIVLVATLAREVNEVGELMAAPMRTIMMALPFLLVWWLPWVFLRQEFRLLPSLRAGLQLLLRLPAISLFPAALILLPTAALSVLPKGVPVAVALGLDAVAILLVWIANIYCVEWLKDHPDTAAAVSPQSAA